MNILHIGLDADGRRWLEAVRRHAGVRTIACVDPDGSNTRQMTPGGRNLDVPRYARIEDALAHVQADAAIVAGRLTSRAAHAVAALDAGLAVMIAPPVGVNAADAARVAAAARRCGRPAMAAQNYRYAPCEYTLRRLVASGKIGRVTHVSCMDRRPTSDAAPSTTPAYPQLMGAAVHHFDSLRSILGLNPVSVIARAGSPPWAADRSGSITDAVLAMADDIHVQYHGAVAAIRAEHALWIDGSDGVLWTDRRRIWWRKRGWPVFVPLFGVRPRTRGDAAAPPLDGTASLIEALRAATMEGRPPETTVEDHLWTIAMLDAAAMSDRTRRTADVEPLRTKAGEMPPAIVAKGGGS